MTMRRHPLPDWLLERHRLGELSPTQEEEVRRGLAEDPRARARLDALEASDRRLLDAHPPGPAAAAIRLRARSQAAPAPARLRAARWLVAAPALAAAVAFAVMIRQPGRDAAPGMVAAEDGTRAKGLRPRLVAYRVSRGGAEILADGATARPGDTLQLAYLSSGRRYGAIVSVDGRGQVSLHLPAAGSEAVALDPRREVALPRAYQLDDAPGFERFFFVTSDSPFAAGPVVAAGRALASSHQAGTGRLALPAGLEQTTLSLQKVAP